ncbi:hypothetical protein B7486_60970 [cyanobacterium TDX16]|nr:hypothetical protein B7486_60970 [cyanobacterium TDX16]
MLVLLLAGASLLVGCSDDGDDGGSDGASDGGDAGGEAATGGDAPEALCAADVLVFLTPGIDDGTVDGVQTALDDAAEVERAVLLDQAATEPVYRVLFADAPATEDPDHQPQSFAVELRGNVDATLFVGDLYATEGVGEVAPVDGQACQIVSGELDLDSP